MLHKLVAVLFFVCFTSWVMGQTKNITGTIKDDKGNPVSYAVIQIKGTNKGFNSDSLGEFSFAVKSNATLLISAMGYESSSVNIGQQVKLSITLKTATGYLTDVSVSSNTKQNLDESVVQKMANNMLQDFMANANINTGGPIVTEGLQVINGRLQATSSSSMLPTSSPFSGLQPGVYYGAALPVFTHKDETKGSKYLYNQWVKGTATNAGNKIITNDAYLYNYDKMGRKLLVTTDKATVIEINKNDLKSFSLIDPNKIENVFEKVALIDADNFFIQLLKDSSGYSLYKSIKTKFVRSNYHSTGLTESGNNYDEYVDEYEYYIVFPKFKDYIKVELKKKSIKDALIKEEAKVKTYFSKNAYEGINEQFLVGLIASLNP